MRDLRNGRFWKRLATHGLAAIGFAAAVLGLFDLFFPNTLGQFKLPGLPVIVVAAIGYAIYHSWPRPVQEHYSTPDTIIKVVTGDLFKQNTSLLIGMSDCFDTATPHIIKESSVQGQFLQRVYRHDLPKLDADIAAALVDQTPTESVAGKPGNIQRYALGTVATLQSHRIHHYCLAFTTMDVNTNVSSTIGIMWDSLEKLWVEVRRRNNGEPLSVPVIGLGQSGMSTILPIQDAVRFIILSFMFASRTQKVCDELRIVVQPSDERRLDMLELQDFLASLKRST